MMIREPQATIMRRSWRRDSSRANHTLEYYSNFNEVRATACNLVSTDSAHQFWGALFARMLFEQDTFDDEELLPLLRFCTDGAEAIEVGGDIVWSAARAPGKLPKSTKCKGILQQCKQGHSKTMNPTLQHDSPNIFFKRKLLNFQG